MADLDPASESAPTPSQTAEVPAALPKPAEATPEKAPPLRARLLDVADAENKQAQRMASLSNDHAHRAELLAVAVPACYLDLVAGLRTAVREFNAKLVAIPDHPIPHINWYETANVALRDAVTGDGMRVRVSRGQGHFDLLLRMVHRSGKSDIPIIEGYGSLGRELVRTETLLRIEGWPENGKVKFWVSLDFKRREIPLEELPDRIVLAVASYDVAVLSRNFVGDVPRATITES